MKQDEQSGSVGAGSHAADLPEPRHGADEIDIAAILRAVWSRKIGIILSTLCITGLAIAYALLATQWYHAEAVLMARESPASGGLASQLGRLGGLADIAGIALTQGSKQEPLGVLRSAGFARRFISQNELVPVLSAEINPLWDEVAVDPDRKLAKTVELFRKTVLSIGEDKKTGLITVGIEWKDPVKAASWANAIPKQLNDEIRRRAIDQSRRNVQFLEQQLARTQTVSLQQALGRIIESEMQKLMLAEGTADYALVVIDDAQPPHKRSRPQRVLLVIGMFLIGLLGSVLVAILLDPVKALWREAKAR
jgi:uncharacterized protein involved in exopolysaccharide biosynthesis